MNLPTVGLANKGNLGKDVIMWVPFNSNKPTKCGTHVCDAPGFEKAYQLDCIFGQACRINVTGCSGELGQFTFPTNAQHNDDGIIMTNGGGFSYPWRITPNKLVETDLPCCVIP